ncbi:MULTISPECIES: DUF2065 domain-containing protein [Lysobacteraceae]|uniref:DUF2065 domain-containing protein n=1 Tax=Novilysobacter avium TaxID=2781023 RepID=A0A7S6ULZ8_9GAMM|nr:MULTISPECIES: DUF2065 domain-containing protein [Lysobacter]QOW22735.1 DUF2065 domain-containing protein [Lysobacter avium]QOW25242.1 DUF2065 domain-containing protein [Lysobacter sp. H23M47]
MTVELLSALSLVAVLEGLFLFAAPGRWRQTMEQLRQLDDRQLRQIGGVVLAVGVVSLWLVRVL